LSLREEILDVKHLGLPTAVSGASSHVGRPQGGSPSGRYAHLGPAYPSGTSFWYPSSLGILPTLLSGCTLKANDGEGIGLAARYIL
jgi:hypothetical protein